MAIYDLYGFMPDDIDGAKDVLESALGMQLDARDSYYQGGGYFQWGKTSDEHFLLKRNVDPIDGEPAEPSFPKYKVLFYANDTSRSESLQKMIDEAAKGFVLLRHEDLK
ncbi:MAG: hypothetical protein E2576_01070 [Alcaligenaceae bacterium]|nr:hypothetical protein [Alcaligenaceae bacterium SAGV5]MPS50181.1 hypothetical protein [Alcaligenaceae bacterium SAGV3]MPT55290.1 hypothetical protein [Alcaligenaceae bacterium]